MILLDIIGVSKRFGGLIAVKDVDMAVEEGEIVGLIGPNGAGKTTLFNLVSGFLSPDSGDIRFDQGSIAGLAPHLICHRGMSRTFQIVKPFPEMSVLDNVMIGAFRTTPKTRKARAIALEVLKLLDFDQWAERRAGDLPIAGRKRLEIAKVLASGPKLILLDEVMAGLTPTEHNRMIETVQKIRMSGITVVIIEHVMPVIMNLCDRVYVLHHGQRIAMGRPKEIVQDPLVMKAYFGKEMTS